jgi:hypothetical protein
MTDTKIHTKTDSKRIEAIRQLRTILASMKKTVKSLPQKPVDST